VEQVVKREVDQTGDQDPIADVMISGVRAAAALKDPELRASIEALSQQGQEPEGASAAAIEALKDRG
jgi:hypothetical protein